ncbi:hypothetical protein GF386_05495 [Candidatus Pacearchaeota archaeon]|nr:hypothetical protein [Candidatus Pacearchaeota archaeon]MBD3283554.1 hypothetical protein [Candidatus Pacearchaeota archaeon]
MAIEDNVERRRLRARRFAEELGNHLADVCPDIGRELYDGATIAGLVKNHLNDLEGLKLESGARYNRNLDSGHWIARIAVRRALSHFLSDDELDEIGKRNMLETAVERGVEGVRARGDIPYDNGKTVVIDGRKYGEMEYAHYLRCHGHSWDAITAFVNGEFNADRNPRSLSQAYHRWLDKIYVEECADPL